MNKVVLIGRLTRDSEFMQPQSSARGVVRFTLAVDRRFSNKAGEREVDFIPVSYWSNYGDKIHSYLIKGKLVGVSGKVTARSYTNAEGGKKYMTEIEADNLQFLDGKKENAV